ncbi:MAG: phosphoribosylanthranilate isomerase [Elusimicrobia bacterium]|nr:phosphoribosylanthranilate isomerase [Elusimicrobiota bacterium]
MTLLKICGITNKADRDLCLKEGADLLGFNLYERSKRFVDRKKLESLLEPGLSGRSVLVGVNKAGQEWSELIESFSPGYIQLHGDEKIDIIKELKRMYPAVKIIKRVAIGESGMFGRILESADYLICDSVSGGYGGSGRSFDWKALEGIPEDVRKRLFVAGGVNADNVSGLLGRVYCIDVASGSEKSPGRKDAGKIRRLAEIIKKYE